MELIADTSFLVGLWRRQSWAISYAKASSGKAIGIPWVVLGEFWHGAVRADHDPDRVHRFLDLGIPLLETAPVILRYAHVCAELQERGCYKEISQNDLWIAAVALEMDVPLITRNRRHFDKVEGLQLVCLTDS